MQKNVLKNWDAIAKAMGKGQSCVGQMAKAVGADTIPIDIGIYSKESILGVISRKVRCGTRNFRKEPAIAILTKELELEPVIDGNMALGEGTGAVMMFALLDVALSIYQGKTTFDDIRIGQYERLS